jgi:hypothetical protein
VAAHAVGVQAEVLGDLLGSRRCPLLDQEGEDLGAGE